METRYYLHLMLFCLLLFSRPVQSQNLLFQEEFAGSLGNWVHSGQSVENWMWEDDPCKPLFDTSGRFCFAAPSVDNGFAMFDSDANGPFSRHDVRLTHSQPVDCSNASEVWVRFSNQYFHAFGVPDPDVIGDIPSIAELGISTNDTTYSYIQVLTDTEPDDLSDTIQEVVLNISNLAAGQPEVYLRFRWRGQFEYFWKIDDVELWDADPRPCTDLGLSDKFFALPPHAYTHKDLQTPFGFLIDLYNNGSCPQEDIQLRASIIGLDGQATYFEDTLDLPALAVDQDVENEPFENVFDDMLETGAYQLVYEVLNAPQDSRPEDNRYKFDFVISDSVMAKERGNSYIDYFPPPFDIDNWSFGNHFYVPHGRGLEVTSVYLELGNTLQNQGQPVLVNLYKWEDTNQDGVAQGIERELVGILENSYRVKGDAERESFRANIVETTTFQDPVPLEDSSHYLLMGAYSPLTSGNPISFRGVPINYLATNFANEEVGGYQYYGAFGGEGSPASASFFPEFVGVPALRMIVQAVTSHVRPPAPKPSFHIQVMPNPASEWLRIKGSGSGLSGSTINARLTNLHGKVISSWHLGGAGNRFDRLVPLEGIAPGYYLLTLDGKGIRRSFPVVIIP